MADEVSPRYERAEAEALRDLFSRFLFLRLTIAPAPLLLVVYVVLVEPALWRRLIFAAAAFSIVTLTLWEYARLRRKVPNALIVPRLLYFFGFLQAAFVFASGGIDSPVLPALILGTVLIRFFGTPLAARLTVVTHVAAVWAVAVVSLYRLVPDMNPELFGGAAAMNPSAGHALATAIAYTIVLGLAFGATGRARLIFNDHMKRTIRTQDEVLASYAEQSRALTALSSEISHELKNPLASVKSLAQMVAKDLDGKPAERLAVLRREADRMQEILDEHLNFSRPLVPLALDDVAVAAICADVVALHEGHAQLRDVRLVVDEQAPVLARCDPRKVKQILVNLVQNALELAPPGSSIELALATEGALAVVEVRDRGPGIAEAVAGRLFEAGVTTREHGSGLGLAIARGLARQHGGELTLSNREGGGAVARLTLPRHGPKQEAA